MTRTAPPALTEKQWLWQVQDLASKLRWTHYHPFLSVRSPRGWPDLALCRPPRLILAELKSDKGKLTAAQALWLELLNDCPAVEVYVWRPADFPDVLEVLR
jgi:hypothetical protein